MERFDGFDHQRRTPSCNLSAPAIGDTRCFLHAQDHLRGFYEQHGFAAVGDVFDEDGIPHVRMERPARP